MYLLCILPATNHRRCRPNVSTMQSHHRLRCMSTLPFHWVFTDTNFRINFSFSCSLAFTLFSLTMRFCYLLPRGNCSSFFVLFSYSFFSFIQNFEFVNMYCYYEMRIFFSLHFQLIFDPVFFYLMHMDTKSTYVLFHVRISSYLNIFHMIVSVCVVCSFAFLSQWLFQQKADTTKKQNILLFVFLFLCIIIIWWMLCLCTAPASQKFLC